MKIPVFNTYENFQFRVEFLNNGYLLVFQDHGTYAEKRKCFTKFDELVEFLKIYYSGDWK